MFFSILCLTEGYDPKTFYGVAKTDPAGNILYIEENPSQIHAKEQYVLIKVKNIKVRPADKEIGRIRIAVWDKKDVYAKEGEKPFRACSYWTKEAKNGEMMFKIGGLTLGASYSFFVHSDTANTGKVKRNFLGIPTDRFKFSNNLTKEGFGPPAFEKTLIKYEKPGQEIILTL
jgi:uncharacterized protein (DUF2141 family)